MIAIYTDAPEEYDFRDVKRIGKVGRFRQSLNAYNHPQENRSVFKIEINQARGEEQVLRYQSGGFVGLNQDQFEEWTKYGDIEND